MTVLNQGSNDFVLNWDSPSVHWLDIHDKDTSIQHVDIKFSKYVDQYKKILLKSEVPQSEFFNSNISEYLTVSSVDDIITASIEGESNTSTLYYVDKNEKDMLFFDSQIDVVKYLCHHVVFEDGYTNELIDKLEQFYQRNQVASLLWLNKFYSNNQWDSMVKEGILRTLTFLDYADIYNVMLPLVKASFNDTDSNIQEVAIMVVENWRTKECLDALETTQYASERLKEYAQKIISELKEELHVDKNV